MALLEKAGCACINDLNEISLANTFNSLANFTKPIFSEEFYKKFYSTVLKTVSSEKSSFRTLASLARAYTGFANTNFYEAIITRVLMTNKSENIDYESLATLLYHTAQFSCSNSQSAELKDLDKFFVKIEQIFIAKSNQ